MLFSFALTAISSFVSMTASRVISMVAGRKITEKSLSKTKTNTVPIKKDKRLINAEINYIQGKSKREQKLIDIQEDLSKMREIEIKANFEIAKAQAARENHALELRERELQIIEEDLLERRNLGYLHLDLIRERNAEELEIKLTEIQADWDRENWSGILSREEMRQILVAGQKKHSLIMIVSPPDIEDCSEFNSHLHKEVRSELKGFLERYYPSDNELCSIEYYGKFFKGSVFDTEVKQLEKNLNPVPSVVIYSDITDQTIYFHVSFCGLEKPIQLTLPWHWREAQEKLILEGLNENGSISVIRQSIVKIHQLIAGFFADLYYLNINPLHEPKLFDIDLEFPMTWLDTNFSILRDIQKARLLDYQNELEKQKVDEENCNQNLQEKTSFKEESGNFEIVASMSEAQYCQQSNEPEVKTSLDIKEKEDEVQIEQINAKSENLIQPSSRTNKLIPWYDPRQTL